MNIFNSLTKKSEEFVSLTPGIVTMYSCGPTVYKDIHIGNFRLFTLSDVVYRALTFNGYKVRYVMNLTDVGHLVSDGDEGEDKLEKEAEAQGKSAKEIADHAIEDFYQDSEKLNLLKPVKYTRATEYIDQQIELVKTLEKKGFTYKTSDGIYFDTSKFEKYGELSGVSVEDIKEGARVEINKEKKHPSDFALWKLSPTDKKRWQEWESPWGVGFPGWHLECSAMSLTELGETLDIHLGGEDLKMIHHQNEIAQSECATGKKFVNYWMHCAFLLVDSGKMSKSLGNFYTVSDIIKNNFDPIALRYFYMGAHYRSPLNFTWDALQSAQNSLKKIYDIIESYHDIPGDELSDKYMLKFNEALDDDFNMPKALSALWELLKSSVSDSKKVATALKMDEVLGLNISKYVGFEIPIEIVDLARARQSYRISGIWDKADMLRRDLLAKGYVVEDLPDGDFKLKRKIS